MAFWEVYLQVLAMLFVAGVVAVPVIAAITWAQNRASRWPMVAVIVGVVLLVPALVVAGTALAFGVSTS